jgi:molybdopterin molybdotransferase
MTELFTVWPPAAAFAELASRVAAPGGVEQIETGEALDRTLAEAVLAGETLPSFPRSTMDGYAVRASDTFGASDASPAYVRLIGEVPMGRAADLKLTAADAIRVSTGAMLPPGADAVVVVEDTNPCGADIEILRAVAPAENTIAVGEDVRAGDVALPAGHRLRAQDLGALHALGITRVTVRRRPVVGILSTGDEVVAPGTQPALGSVRDVNAVTIGATVTRAGGEPRSFGIVGDDEDAIVARGRVALAACDALVLSAGSSVSARDMTARAIDRLGAPGAFVHGIALRPGKPTILGICDRKPVVGLPGNPVSALVVAWRLVRPLVRLLAGTLADDDGFGEDAGFEARLTAPVASRPGREEYVPVRLTRSAAGVLEATPVYGKSSLIFTLVRSHGLLAIPFDRAGLGAGEPARVIVP